MSNKPSKSAAFDKVKSIASEIISQAEKFDPAQLEMAARRGRLLAEHVKKLIADLEGDVSAIESDFAKSGKSGATPPAPAAAAAPTPAAPAPQAAAPENEQEQENENEPGQENEQENEPVPAWAEPSKNE